MTTLSLERLTRTSRRSDASATTGLKRFVTKQATALHMSLDAAAAYDRARTPAARRAVLDHFATRIAG